MENEVQVEKSRKTSRISRGLNPDAPKPPQAPKGTFLFIQMLLEMSRRPMPARWTKRQVKFRRWMNTRLLYRSCAIVSELTYRLA
jgi:hypothetical protein